MSMGESNCLGQVQGRHLEDFQVHAKYILIFFREPKAREKIEILKTQKMVLFAPEIFEVI